MINLLRVMKRAGNTLSLLAVSLVLTTTACMDCNREACGVWDDRASTESVTQGLAGAAIFISDVTGEYMGQTCQECIFLDTKIRIWKAAAPVTTADAATALCTGRAPDAVAVGAPWYEVALDVGYYLACTNTGDTICVGFSIAADKITTLHDTTTGRFSVHLSEPGEKPTQEDNVFGGICTPEMPSGDNAPAGI
jgi:hypothetical protein